VLRRDARVLILGSMPGDASLRAGRYYAHPRNAFWPILAELTGCPALAPYRQRTAALRRRGIALWDVLAACRRRGSLDASIDKESIIINDFEWLFNNYSRISTVLLNGGLAARLFERRVRKPLRLTLDCQGLPSTSPAHAGMRFEEKRRIWLEALEDALD
jgi:hypoxanthine-DNA glycosylase